MTQEHEGAGRPFAQLEWDLVDRLQKTMRVGGLSVQQVAEVFNVNRNTVGNYLSGRTRPSHTTLAAWAFLGGVPFRWLLTGEVPDGPEPVDGVSMFDAGARPANYGLRAQAGHGRGRSHLRLLPVAA